MPNCLVAHSRESEEAARLRNGAAPRPGIGREFLFRVDSQCAATYAAPPNSDSIANEPRNHPWAGFPTLLRCIRLFTHMVHRKS
jgi:hypothetical protein